MIAVSKIVSTMLDQSDSNLKRSLTLVSAYTSVDQEMAVCCYILLCIYDLKISIPMNGRLKESHWAITKISPNDNSREALNMIQLL